MQSYWGHSDLNAQPSDLGSDALPLRHSPICQWVGLTYLTGRLPRADECCRVGDCHATRPRAELNRDRWIQSPER